MLTRENIQDIYELSPMQKSILFNHAMYPSSSAYTQQFDFSLKGHIAPDKMKTALSRISDCHDILRTIFSYRKTDQPRQVVLKSCQPELFVKDLREYYNPEEIVESYKDDDKKKGFDISRDVLIRAALLQVNEKQWRFIFTFHHIILDGWSLAPIFYKLFDLYKMIAQSGADSFEGETYPFKNYIKWLRNQNENKAASYWENYLKGYEKPVKLPSKKINNNESYLYANHTFVLPHHLNEGLSDLAKSLKVTLNTIFQTIWGVLLQKYNHTDDVVFGNVVSGRPTDLKGVESMVGMFINSQPLRVQTEKGESFTSLCYKIYQANFESSPYEYYPLYNIQGHSPLKNNLLNHVVAFENYPFSEQMQELEANDTGAFIIENVNVFERSNYDFGIVVNPGKNFTVHFTYNQNRYTKKTMEGLQRSLISLFESAIAHPDSPVDLLNLCSSYDEEMILDTFNDLQKTYSEESTIDYIFRRIVLQYPEKEALKWRDQTFTYSELDVRSDQLAQKLLNMGIGKHDTVGLYLPRCPEMVVGLLGILKIGAICVPLDVSDSENHTKYKLENAGIQVICTKSELNSQFLDHMDIILLNESLNSNENELTNSYVNSTHNAKSQAYLMYTSGSTGRPKGCMITHRNILSMVFGPEFIDFGSHQVILQTGSPAFDASLHDIWGSLLHGGVLVLADQQDLLDFGRMEKLLAKHRIRTMFLTTALFNKISDNNPKLFESLKNVLIGGEIASPKHCKQVQQMNPNLKITNGYGPTENTTCSTAYIVKEEDFESDNIPIGSPLANKSVYILDQGQNLLPVGAVGEICVGGAGVSSGYYNMPEKTSQYFLNDPFVDGGSLYRTGDLGRWLPDGSLEYLGRTDSLVKIRGYRVELNEIERVMKNLPNINEVTVQVRNINQDKQLCAYFSADGNYETAEFRKKLSSDLPQYMIPSFFIKMETLPLTVYGKVDHEALPEPNYQSTANAVTQPSGKLEKELADIWASVIGIGSEDIGVNDNFFDIGGNSLNMISLNNRLKKRFNKDIPLTTLFEHTSVASLAKYLEFGEEDRNNEQKQEFSQAKNVFLRTRSLIKSKRE